MTSENHTPPLLLTVVASAVLGLSGLGCGDDGTAGGGNDVVVLEPVEGNACITRPPAPGDPNLIAGPSFPREIGRGMPVEGEVTVDAETRIVTVDLANLWHLDAPPIGSQTVRTDDGGRLSFSFPTNIDTRGRFFFRITLCAADCAARRSVFTVVENPDTPDSRNDPYRRIVFEGDIEVENVGTCLEPDSVVVQ